MAFQGEAREEAEAEEGLEEDQGFRSTKALQESSLKAFKNFNPEIEEHSKQNHPNYLTRS